MTTANTAGRGLAIAAGVVLATGTLAILFEDVLMHGAQFTLKHWLTLVTVAGTMMVGHLADLARRHGHWMSVAGFTLLFLAGTGLVVYSSVGRQAEKTMLSSAEHDEVVQKRNDLKSKLAMESAALKAKLDAADLECKSGDGPLCKGARALATVWAESVAGLEARIEKLAPAKPIAPEAEQFATVAAALGYDQGTGQGSGDATGAVLHHAFPRVRDHRQLRVRVFPEASAEASWRFSVEPSRAGSIRLSFGDRG